MKIVIAHRKTKREIDGPFNICGSYNDLHWIAEQLTKTLEQSGDFNFGWIRISDMPVFQDHIPDTPPIGWDEQEKFNLDWAVITSEKGDSHG